MCMHVYVCVCMCMYVYVQCVCVMCMCNVYVYACVCVMYVGSEDEMSWVGGTGVPKGDISGRKRDTFNARGVEHSGMAEALP